MKTATPVFDQILHLVRVGAVARIRLRADVWRQLVREARADAWGTHDIPIGRIDAVRVAGVEVTERLPLK